MAVLNWRPTRQLTHLRGNVAYLISKRFAVDEPLFATEQKNRKKQKYLLSVISYCDTKDQSCRIRPVFLFFVFDTKGEMYNFMFIYTVALYYYLPKSLSKLLR